MPKLPVVRKKFPVTSLRELLAESLALAKFGAAERQLNQHNLIVFPVNSLRNREIQTERGSPATVPTAKSLDDC